MSVCFGIVLRLPFSISFFFFFNDTATTEIYTLSLHDALPISSGARVRCANTNGAISSASRCCARRISSCLDRKSTRLNSSHLVISYAVFCLKKKKNRELNRARQNQTLGHRGA